MGVISEGAIRRRVEQGNRTNEALLNALLAEQQRTNQLLEALLLALTRTR